MNNDHHKVIIGMQWGDEGKGKIVDVLSQHYDIISRFQGGNNAGHTIVKNNQTYKLSLLPSGVLTEGKKAFIGPGVVLDPLVFQQELAMLNDIGMDDAPDRIAVSAYATLILPQHQKEDAEREDNRTQKQKNHQNKNEGGGKDCQSDMAKEASQSQHRKIGTTGRGIGPAYAARAHRDAVRLYELFDDTKRSLIIQDIHRNHGQDTAKTYDRAFDILLPYIDIDTYFLEKAHEHQESIIFEGAQGLLLDKDFGSYPFVTSSNTVPMNIGLGALFPMQNITHILGVFKAYTTRVGEGPFPTEQDNEIGDLLGEKGGEFGTVTGRKRRCGWLDLVLLKHMVGLCKIDQLCITKIDVLDHLTDIQVATSYVYDQAKLLTMPQSVQNQVKNNVLDPIMAINLGLVRDVHYTTLPAWPNSGGTAGKQFFADLPDAAKDYIKFIEDYLEVSISIISTGPDHDDVIDC
jgi:adenylosuccinate synthase